MTLLEDIQNSAIDGSSDLGTLLRKCKLLAARLRSQPLEDWLIWESNGYPDDIPVPDYRVCALEIKGHFVGPLGSGLRNAPIPLACLPKEVFDKYKNYECRQSIASIEEVLNRAKGKNLRVSTGDLALKLGTNVYEYQNCMQAWAEYPISHLIELLNSVRNRILDFALAVWKEAPNAGEVGNGPSSRLESPRVTQIFNTIVYGGSANLIGSSNSSSIFFNIVAQDFPSLSRVLNESGIAKEDIETLRLAIESDPAPTEKNKFGPRVSAWIAKMMEKAAEGIWKISLGAAGSILAQAIAKYYGL